MFSKKLHRRGAVYLADPNAGSMPLDRNGRARLIALAEGYERRTKMPGRKIGALGHVGLEVLRAMLFRFAGGKSRCWPSYRALAVQTGRSIDAIAGALKRLEAAGFLVVTRRKQALRVGRVMFIRQDTNVYDLVRAPATARIWSAAAFAPLEKERAWVERVRKVADSEFQRGNYSKIEIHRKSTRYYGLVAID